MLRFDSHEASSPRWRPRSHVHRGGTFCPNGSQRRELPPFDELVRSGQGNALNGSLPRGSDPTVNGPKGRNAVAGVCRGRAGSHHHNERTPA